MGTRKFYTERPRRQPTATLLWNLLQLSPGEVGVVLKETFIPDVFGANASEIPVFICNHSKTLAKHIM